MTERTDEDIDRLGESARGARSDITALGRAADAAGTAFGGIIRGAPRTLSEFTDGVTRIIGVGGPVSRAMQFAEGYIGVWQGLTKYGINFGNELDEMIIKTGQANMRMEDLARVAQQSSVDLAGFGGSANAGLQEFLSAQAQFYREQEGNFDGLQARLMSLGLTTEDINERFLTFDMMTNIRNRRQLLTDEERNRQAGEFAENMDRLARLTGQQADELAREQLELQRQGNIYATQMELPAATQQQLVDTITRMGAFGETVGNVTTDILTRGFIDPNDPAALALQSFAPDLINTLYAAREAMQQGDVQEARRLEALAAEQAGALRNNRDFLQMARLGGANEYTRGIQQIVTELNTSSEALSQAAVLARLTQENLEPTYENMAAMRARMIEEEKNAQLERTPANQMIRTYNETMMELQAVARVAQERTVEGFTGLFESAAEEISNAIRTVNLAETIDSAFNEAFGAFGSLGRADDLAAGLQDYQRVLADEAARFELEGDTARADLAQREAEEAGRLLQRLNEGADPAEIRREAERLAQTIRASQVTISARDVTVTSSAVQRATEGSTTTGPQSIGTLGNFNRLFRDFGTESLVPLHGVEAVMTPDQVEELLQRGSSGTMRSLVAEINRSMMTTGMMDVGAVEQLVSQTRNITSTLDGRLNTLRTSISREVSGSQTGNTQALSEELRNIFSTMPRDLRRAFEEALGNTIKTPIDQLASTSNRSADYQERIFKNTRGISGDLLRGA